MKEYPVPFNCQIVFHYMVIPYFIYPVDGNLDFFNFVAVVNNVAMNTRVYLCIDICFLLGIYLEPLGDTVTLCLTF